MHKEMFQYYNISGVSPEIASFWKKDIYLCVHQENILEKNELEKLLSQYGKSFYVWSHISQLPVMDETELESYIEQITSKDLLVVCVTKEFMRQDDISWYEFQEALKHNMQILPVVYDEEEFVKFNSISENIQALIIDRDDTKIPFEMKLARYLQNIFGVQVSEKKGSELDKAFDAKLVISYRKKDRKYIKPIFEAIHAEQDLQHVGIWYDESLQLGEDYSDQIWEKFEEADMAILLITENLLEPDNFVAKEEYPYLCELGKTILPITVNVSDLESVSKFFIDTAQKKGKDVPAIHNAIPLEESIKIAQEVRKGLLEKGVLKERLDGNPDDSYNLGMAYQTEYLVEQSTDLAQKYLREAASLGKHEAYEQLSKNYQHGIGVKRDTKEAKHIQQNYVDYLLKTRAQWDHNDRVDAIAALKELAKLQEVEPGTNDYVYCRILVEICEEDCKGTGDLDELLKLNMMKFYYANARMRFKYYMPIGKVGLDAVPLVNIYDELAAFYQELGQKYSNQELKPMGNGYRLVGRTGMYEPELVQAINEGYLEALFHIGEIRCLYANDQNDIIEAVHIMEDVVRTKEKLMYESADRWAVTTLGQEYKHLIERLYKKRLDSVAIDYIAKYNEYLKLLECNKIMIPEYLLISVRNDIYLADIFARNGEVHNIVDCFYSAMKMIKRLRENNIDSTKYELEIQKRISKEMYEQILGLLDEFNH